MPMGAPGWPELALEVASTWNRLSASSCLAVASRRNRFHVQMGDESPPIAHEKPSQRGERTYRENTDGVDRQLVQISETHNGRF